MSRYVWEYFVKTSGMDHDFKFVNEKTKYSGYTLILKKGSIANSNRASIYRAEMRINRKVGE